MTESRMGKAVRTGATLLLMIAMAGCTYNPLLGKWSIKSHDKEADATFVDELTTNTRTSTGATTIDFLKDSIVISGGPHEHTETGITYIIQELEGGGTQVSIVQARKGDPDNNDVDVCHVDSTGKSARLESRNQTLSLARLGE
jgi:hypothetical protein